MAITMTTGTDTGTATGVRRRAGAGSDWYGLWLEPPARTRTRTQGRPVRLPTSTYRRRRAVAAGLVVVLVLAVWVALGTLGGGPLPAPERPGTAADAGFPNGQVYVVQQGDTLWSIARRLRPEADPRPLVDRLVAARGGTTLHVGERIPLPAR